MACSMTKCSVLEFEFLSKTEISCWGMFNEKIGSLRGEKDGRTTAKLLLSKLIRVYIQNLEMLLIVFPY